jgi:hypothetical protein
VKYPKTGMKSTDVVLVLLLLIPALLNFYAPYYNMVNPTLGGLPFFWWFQILLLVIVVPFYLAFTYLQKHNESAEPNGGVTS